MPGNKSRRHGSKRWGILLGAGSYGRTPALTNQPTNLQESCINMRLHRVRSRVKRTDPAKEPKAPFVLAVKFKRGIAMTRAFLKERTAPGSFSHQVGAKSDAIRFRTSSEAVEFLKTQGCITGHTFVKGLKAIEVKI